MGRSQTAQAYGVDFSELTVLSPPTPTRFPICFFAASLLMSGASGSPFRKAKFLEVQASAKGFNSVHTGQSLRAWVGLSTAAPNS